MRKITLTLTFAFLCTVIFAQTDSLAEKINKHISAEQMYKMGQADARRYYKKYSGAGTGVMMVGTVLTPIAGLIPAIGASATPVQDKNLNYPDKELFANIDYREGYKAKANSKKKGRVWMNWGISWLTAAVVYGVISSAVQNSN
ncbi:MAG TPA: hypothetical protein PK110_10495 [Niabella sp.]|nr:hypothetical protein [Niabella sp.]